MEDVQATITRTHHIRIAWMSLEKQYSLRDTTNMSPGQLPRVDHVFYQLYFIRSAGLGLFME